MTLSMLRYTKLPAQYPCAIKSGVTTVAPSAFIVATVLLESMQALACRSISHQHCVLSHIYSCTPLKANISRRMDYFWRRRAIDNTGLVNSLRENGTITTSRVAEVMEQIDRGLFVPAGVGDPYFDTPAPIGYNATISAPHMHAACLELLKDHLQPGMRALDIGSAIFALLVGETGRAVGVEHISELTEKSVENVQKCNAAHLLTSDSLSLHTGDGRKGYPDLAPYDAIHVGAAAPTIPPALIEQLKPGGRMVIPVGDVFQDLVVIDKDMQGEVKQWDYTQVRYVPLTDRQMQLEKEQ
uniref:Protein-L-isoaspartate O-methyltransferase n=1 Tax=Physcomitrium patens TaxID=3218 RepID=A0A7I4EFB1_PHYPA